MLAAGATSPQSYPLRRRGGVPERRSGSAGHVFRLGSGPDALGRTAHARFAHRRVAAASTGGGRAAAVADGAVGGPGGGATGGAWRGSASRWPTPSTMPTSRARCTATSSRPTCCWTPRHGLGHRFRAGQAGRPRRPDPFRRHGGHAALHGAGAVRGEGRRPQRRLRPGPDALRAVDAAAGVRPAGPAPPDPADDPGGAAAAAEARSGHSPRPGDDRRQGDGRRPGPSLPNGRRTGRRPSLLPRRPAHPRPPHTPAGRLWRWCRRNRAVAALSGAALALLVAVAVVASVGYFSRSGDARRTWTVAGPKTPAPVPRPNGSGRKPTSRLATKAFEDIFDKVAGDTVTPPPAEDQQAEPERRP